MRPLCFSVFPHRTFTGFWLARIYRQAVVEIYKHLIIEHVIIRLYLSESLVMVYQASVCWQQWINSTVCLITISVCCHHVNADRLLHPVLDLCGYTLVWGNVCNAIISDHIFSLWMHHQKCVHLWTGDNWLMPTAACSCERFLHNHLIANIWWYNSQFTLAFQIVRNFEGEKIL